MQNHEHVAKAIGMFCTDDEFEDQRVKDPHPTHRVTIFVSPIKTVKVTRRSKIRRGGKQEFIVTIGRPNWHERQRIKQFKKVGEPFPVKRPQLHYDPPKKR
jgi:hypothetical protein